MCIPIPYVNNKLLIILTFHLLLKTPSKFIAFNFTGTFKYYIYIIYKSFLIYYIWNVDILQVSCLFNPRQHL